MTTQSGFTPEEWTLLRIVPSFAAAGVSAADPSGIYGSIKESTAGPPKAAFWASAGYG
jgi:hypothetical protein